MKLSAKKLLTAIIACFTSITISLGWGAWGHQHINRAAVMALPPGIGSFFYNHIDFITEEAGVPDLRKYVLGDKIEFQRHTLYVEHFNRTLDSFPRTLSEAKAAYDSTFLLKNGILPWYIQDMMTKLTNAFRLKRKNDILFLAADLGHYIGDAHMPLHVSANHDGNESGQKGIHPLFEAQIVEHYGPQYNFYTGNATYIPDVNAAIWAMIRHSHALADTMLQIDKQLRTSLPNNQIFVLDSLGNIKRNKFNDYIHTTTYMQRYHQLLNGMVERQLRSATQTTASFWYTAWINAGQPNLNTLDAPELTQRNAPFYQKDHQLWRKGKEFGLQSDPEF